MSKKAQHVDVDVIDRIFILIGKEATHLTDGLGEQRLKQIKATVRQEFGGADCWIRSQSRDDRALQVQRILSFFNGRNATQTARELGISRATVYRKLKQAALHRAANDSQDL